jgi:hypothetical protein
VIAFRPGELVFAQGARADSGIFVILSVSKYPSLNLPAAIVIFMLFVALCFLVSFFLFLGLKGFC